MLSNHIKNEVNKNKNKRNIFGSKNRSVAGYDRLIETDKWNKRGIGQFIYKERERDRTDIYKHSMKVSFKIYILA